MNHFRYYPNEELIRLLARLKTRGAALDLGCGAGGNTWALAQHGFTTRGIDNDPAALAEAAKNLRQHDATLTLGDMTALAWDDESFDLVIDCFSSYCLTTAQADRVLRETYRVLRPGGVFWSFHPSKHSDAWRMSSNRTDDWTLDSIVREGSPYIGHPGPFRFLYPGEYIWTLRKVGFAIDYCEELTRTYGLRERFSMISIAGTKAS